MVATRPATEGDRTMSTTFRSAVRTLETLNREADCALNSYYAAGGILASPGDEERLWAVYRAASRRYAAAHAEVWRIGRAEGRQVPLDEEPHHPVVGSL
jgi:hypothetical protein